MISKENEEQLGKLGLTVDSLKEAINSEEEVSLSISLPQTTGLSDEDAATLSKNRFEEGQKAALEVKAKAIKKAYGLDVVGKDMDTVLRALEAKVIADNANTDALKDNELLKSSIKELETKLEAVHSEYASKAFDSDVNSELRSLVPEGTAIPADKIVSLYRMENNIENIDGTRVITKDGEVVKNKLENLYP